METTDDTRIANYLKNEGVRCPYCEDYDIDAKDPHLGVGEGMVYMDCRCHKCGGEWTDEYKLFSVQLNKNKSFLSQ